MNTLDTILDTGIIAIARGFYGEGLINAVNAMHKSGIRAFEVTFEQNGSMERTAEAIRMLRVEFPDSAIGAGTVLTEEQLAFAYEAGASYVVSPNTDAGIIRRTKSLGLVSVPGAMTPSEIMEAHLAGADIVKLFPAGELGIEYFKAIRAPLSHIKLAAVAGITLDNIAAFHEAGACAFGISSGLFRRSLIESGNFTEIERIAWEYAAQIVKNKCDRMQV